MQGHVAERVAGRSVLCAVSGGVDSVVLLHLLLRAGVRTVAAHAEHGIRGENSLRDRAFVEALCARWKVPLVTCSLDVPSHAAAAGRGLEETARELRYAFLHAQRQALGLDVIATAHHLGDQAETLLLHIIRGTSPAGLSGMAEEEGVLLRPLLPFTRQQILDYARAQDLEWVEDETNADTAFSRNYVRHELIPRMEHLNPRAVEALGRLARLARAQNDYVAQQARSLLEQRQHGEALDDVRDLPEGLRGAVLAAYLTKEGLQNVSCADIERLQSLFAMGTGKRVSLGKELFERDTNGIRRVIMKAASPCWPLHEGENNTPLGRFNLKTGPVPQDWNLGHWTQALDAHKIHGELCVRTRREGDRVRLLGGGTRKLSDVLTDKKVPRALRDQVPLVECGGEIIWVVGIAPCAGCALGPDSTCALTIDYHAAKE